MKKTVIILVFFFTCLSGYAQTIKGVKAAHKIKGLSELSLQDKSLLLISIRDHFWLEGDSSFVIEKVTLSDTLRHTPDWMRDSIVVCYNTTQYLNVQSKTKLLVRGDFGTLVAEVADSVAILKAGLDKLERGVVEPNGNGNVFRLASTINDNITLHYTTVEYKDFTESFFVRNKVKYNRLLSHYYHQESLMPVEGFIFLVQLKNKARYLVYCNGEYAALSMVRIPTLPN